MGFGLNTLLGLPDKIESIIPFLNNSPAPVQEDWGGGDYNRDNTRRFGPAMRYNYNNANPLLMMPKSTTPVIQNDFGQPQQNYTLPERRYEDGSSEWNYNYPDIPVDRGRVKPRTHYLDKLLQF